jgi:pilus assembly protein CpaB
VKLPKFRLGKNWIVLGAALAVGGVAAFSVQRYIRGQMLEIEARDRKEMVKVVVAKDNLPKGGKLSANTMAVREVPREWLHSNAITPAQFERAEGGVLAHPASKGEPVLWAQLEAPKPPSFSTRLAAGRRAVTVPVDEISSLSGMVEPGDLIDLIVSVRKGDRHVTFALMQSVSVLATGTRVSPGEREGPARTFTTITLDASPEEAQRVIAAREVGRITALLRAPGDKAPVSSQRADSLVLLGLNEGSAAGMGWSNVPVIYGGGPIKDPGRLGPREEQKTPAGGDMHGRLQ